MEENVFCEFDPKEKKQICLGEEDKAIIASSCRWAKFLAIVGFVMIGLMVLLFLMMLLGVAVAGMAIPGMGVGGAKAMTAGVIVGLAILLVYFFPIFYLYRYASRGLKAIATNDDVIMTESFLNLKRYFKFTGIFTIVVIFLYLLVFIISFAAGYTGMMHGFPHM